ERSVKRLSERCEADLRLLTAPAAKWPAPGVRDTTDAFYWRGVWELKESDERSWYRVIYLSRIADVVCVLHGFEKQSRRTSARDIVVARNRLKQVLNRVRGEKK